MTRGKSHLKLMRIIFEREIKFKRGEITYLKRNLGNTR